VSKCVGMYRLTGVMCGQADTGRTG
jgi:hypothetical protein